MPEPRPVTLTAAQVRTALAGGAVELRRKLRPADWLISGLRPSSYGPLVWPGLRWDKAFRDGGADPYWHVPVEAPVGHVMHDTVHWVCPRIRPGDRLWVREAWALAHRNTWGGLPKTIGPDGHEAAYYREGFDRSPPRWQSPATMPRWASRLPLVVTGLRLEPGEERPFIVEARKDG